MSVTVARLRVSPIKGLRQKEVAALDLVQEGLAGDRRFVLVGDNGRVRYGAELDGLADVTADWDPQAALLVLAHGQEEVARAPLELGEPLEVRSTSGARAVAGRPVLGPCADVLSELAGEPLGLLHVGPGVAAPGQITVIGDGSIRRVADAVGVDAVDSTRFRMTIELSGLDAHEEDEWGGRLARIGASVVRIGDQVPRCVLITREPTTRVRDLDLLRAILSYRAPMATGEAPLGVYATVVEPGRISVGDAVTLAD